MPGNVYFAYAIYLPHFSWNTFFIWILGTIALWFPTFLLILLRANMGGPKLLLFLHSFLACSDTSLSVHGKVSKKTQSKCSETLTAIWQNNFTSVKCNSKNKIKLKEGTCILCFFLSLLISFSLSFIFTVFDKVFIHSNWEKNKGSLAEIRDTLRRTTFRWSHLIPWF